MPDTKITTHEQRFGNVNATNLNSYLIIICINLVTQVKKYVSLLRSLLQ